jgi:hypothetical protein
MSPSLPLQVQSTPPALSTAGAGEGFTPPAAEGADFLQALQQGFARIQQPQAGLAPMPLDSTLAPLQPGEGRALLVSLLAMRQQMGKEGTLPGEESVLATPEMTEEALAMLKQWLTDAGDTSTPGTGAIISSAAPLGLNGHPLPPGESLPPDTLANEMAVASSPPPDAARRDGGRAASAASPAGDNAAPGAVPAPAASAFSAVLDDMTVNAAPQQGEMAATPSEASLSVAAQSVVMNPPAAAPQRPAPPPVATPLGHPGWDAEMSERIVWMTSKSMSSAEIHLNPPNLGPVEVRISLNQDQQASIQFVSPHAAVREALEAAMPKLRDLFGAQQLSLADVSVSQHPAGQQPDSQQARAFQQQQQSSLWRGSQPEFPLGEGRGLTDETEGSRPVRIGQGLLNLYV